MALTRDMMLGKKPELRTEKVSAEEFAPGETLTVKALNHDEWLEVLGAVENKEQIHEHSLMFVASVVDESGNPIFRREDIPAIRRSFPAAVINRVVRAVRVLNGLNEKN